MISEPVSGMGTNDEEKGVAPGLNGTFGLLVELRVELEVNIVANEPAK